MSELAPVDESSLELLPPAQAPSVNAQRMLVCHAEMMATAHQLATAMVTTEMVPARFRNKPDDAAAAILYGAELGLNPIQSLQRIIPIYGMPTLEARTMVALLKSRGYKIQTVAQSDESVTVLGTDLQGESYESTWTMQRALKAGYVPTLDEKTGKYKTNSKGNLIGNEKYLSDPQAMLKAKAQAEVCRDMAPDVLLGISYTSEELQTAIGALPPASRQLRSAPLTVEEIFAEAPTRQPASDLDEFPSAPGHGGGNDASQGAEPSSGAISVPDSHDQDAPDEPPTAAMNRKMHALFRDAGLSDRDDRLTVTSAILGYRLDTSANLTKSEAMRIIETLDGWQQHHELEREVNEILNRAAIAAENQSLKEEEN